MSKARLIGGTWPRCCNWIRVYMQISVLIFFIAHQELTAGEHGKVNPPKSTLYTQTFFQPDINLYDGSHSLTGFLFTIRLLVNRDIFKRLF